jgi:hypothetical protein
LLTHLVGQSRLIVTSRYLPAELTPLPPAVREWQLGEFSEAAFLKFLWREPLVERRYRAGELLLLHELVPTATIIALLINPTSPNAETQSREMQAAARTFGLQLDIVHASADATSIRCSQLWSNCGLGGS